MSKIALLSFSSHCVAIPVSYPIIVLSSINTNDLISLVPVARTLIKEMFQFYCALEEKIRIKLVEFSLCVTASEAFLLM